MIVNAFKQVCDRKSRTGATQVSFSENKEHLA